MALTRAIWCVGVSQRILNAQFQTDGVPPTLDAAHLRGQGRRPPSAADRSPPTLSSKFGAYETVKAKSWPRLEPFSSHKNNSNLHPEQVESLHLSARFVFADKDDDARSRAMIEICCRANLEQTSQSRPDYGLDCQVLNFEPFSVWASRQKNSTRNPT